MRGRRRRFEYMSSLYNHLQNRTARHRTELKIPVVIVADARIKGGEGRRQNNDHLLTNVTREPKNGGRVDMLSFGRPTQRISCMRPQKTPSFSLKNVNDKLVFFIFKNYHFCSDLVSSIAAARHLAYIRRVCHCRNETGERGRFSRHSPNGHRCTAGHHLWESELGQGQTDFLISAPPKHATEELTDQADRQRPVSSSPKKQGRGENEIKSRSVLSVIPIQHIFFFWQKTVSASSSKTTHHFPEPSHHARVHLLELVGLHGCRLRSRIESRFLRS